MLDLWPSLKLEGWDIDEIVSDTHARCASSEACIFHKYLLQVLSFLVVMVFLILNYFFKLQNRHFISVSMLHEYKYEYFCYQLVVSDLQTPEAKIF